MTRRPNAAIPLSFHHFRPMQGIEEPKIPIRHLPLKRIFDIVFSSCALLFFTPVIVGAMIAIRLTSKGPALFSHPRVGRGGILFPCYKLRTMYSDADKRLADLLANDPERCREWGKNQKLKDDPRVTPIGKFLRKTSIDELPQFWNVFIGDLSVVGPRPVVEKEVTKFLRHRAPAVLSMRPGLTCTWQVSGRSDTSRSRRVAMDVAYVRNQSLRLDIALIARTIPAMLGSRGAY